MRLTVDFDKEEDGRVIAVVLELPGVMVYGATRDEALTSAMALALDVLSCDLRDGDRRSSDLMTVEFVVQSET